MPDEEKPILALVKLKGLDPFEVELSDIEQGPKGIIFWAKQQIEEGSEDEDYFCYFAPYENLEYIRSDNYLKNFKQHGY